MGLDSVKSYNVIKVAEEGILKNGSFDGVKYRKD